jgi:hypothetical protein
MATKKRKKYYVNDEYSQYTEKQIASSCAVKLFLGGTEFGIDKLF